MRISAPRQASVGRASRQGAKSGNLQMFGRKRIGLFTLTLTFVNNFQLIQNGRNVINFIRSLIFGAIVLEQMELNQWGSKKCL
jgi:hypothetical protein